MELCIQYICIPDLLANSDAFQKASKPVRDQLAAFCFVMLKAGCLRRDKDGRRKRWNNAGFKAFQKYLGRAYVVRTRTLLIKLGVIQYDKKYRSRNPNNLKAFGYRFTKVIREDSFRHYRLETSKAAPRFARADAYLKSRSENIRPIKGKATEIHRTLYEMMTRLQLSEAAILQGVESSPLARRCDRYYRGINFASRQFSATVDDTGRFYTTLTKLWKGHRHRLTLDGEPLIEIDISACQPLMLSIMAEPFVPSAECMEFRRLAATGTLYEEISKSTERDVKKTKTAMIAFLCGDLPRLSALNRIRSSGPKSTWDLVHLWFSQNFPEITEYLRTTKTSKESGAKMNTPERRKAGKKTGAYCITAFEMQRLEAEIIIGGVCAEFIESYRGEFIATVHDAVMVSEKNVEPVIERMKSEFSKRGLYPSMKQSREGELINIM